MPSTRSTARAQPRAARRSSRAASRSATRSSGARSTTPPAPAGGWLAHERGGGEPAGARRGARGARAPRRSRGPPRRRAGDRGPARRGIGRARPGAGLGGTLDQRRARADAPERGVPPARAAASLAGAQAAAGQVEHADDAARPRSDTRATRSAERVRADRPVRGLDQLLGPTAPPTSGWTPRSRRCPATPRTSTRSSSRSRSTRSIAECEAVRHWGERADAAGRGAGRPAPPPPGSRVVAFADALIGDMSSRALTLMRRSRRALRRPRRRRARRVPRGGAVHRPGRDVHRALRRGGRARAAAASRPRARPARPRCVRPRDPAGLRHRDARAAATRLARCSTARSSRTRLLDSDFAAGLGADERRARRSRWQAISSRAGPGDGGRGHASAGIDESVVAANAKSLSGSSSSWRGGRSPRSRRCTTRAADPSCRSSAGSGRFGCSSR